MEPTTMHAVLTEINRSGYRDYSKALKLNKAMHTNTEMKKPNELRALSCSEVRILKISISFPSKIRKVVDKGTGE